MTSYINSLDAYNEGMKNFLISDYVEAKKWFKIAYDNPKYKSLALAKLLAINLRQGKYAKVRNILKETEINDSAKLQQIYGMLENIENNFERSKSYYNACMSNPLMQRQALMSLAKLYIQTGDYDIAESMLETLEFDNSSKVQTILSMINLCMLKQDFDRAYKLLISIDKSKLSPRQAEYYRVTNIYLLYLLGKLKKENLNPKWSNNYTLYRFLDSSDESLVKHVERHKDQRLKYSKGCFFEDTDIVSLIAESITKIATINANHFETSDMYRFHLDKPIGFKGDCVTNDLCVVTLLGTKDIITMYPVLLSDEFDIEGNSHSEELKLKRLRGINK